MYGYVGDAELRRLLVLEDSILLHNMLEAGNSGSIEKEGCYIIYYRCVFGLVATMLEEMRISGN